MVELVRAAGLDHAIEVDSAGTGDWHVGESPDPRTASAAKRRGFDLDHAAQQFTRKDFDRFDYVVAMDRSNLRNLERLAPSDAARKKLYLFRSFEAERDDHDVPDPYYGGEAGFDRVLDICVAACRGLLDHLRAEHDLDPGGAKNE